MKINWKRIVIAGIWSEIALFVIHLALQRKFTGITFEILDHLNFFVLMFLGGLWVVRKVESRFLLHGVLVGLVAQVLWGIVVVVLILSQMPGKQPSPDNARRLLIGFFVSLTVKVLGSAAGACVGGIRRKKPLSAQV